MTKNDVMKHDVRKDGDDFDKRTTNTIPSSEKKGTMEIKPCDKVFFYLFDQQSKVDDVWKALAKYFSLELGFGTSGNYRLKYLNNPSFLFAYQPIWAELGENPVVEVVVSLKGGGKRGRNERPADDLMQKVFGVKGQLYRGCPWHECHCGYV